MNLPKQPRQICLTLSTSWGSLCCWVCQDFLASCQGPGFNGTSESVKSKKHFLVIHWQYLCSRGLLCAETWTEVERPFPWELRASRRRWACRRGQRAISQVHTGLWGPSLGTLPFSQLTLLCQGRRRKNSCPPECGPG